MSVKGKQDKWSAFINSKIVGTTETDWSDSCKWNKTKGVPSSEEVKREDTGEQHRVSRHSASATVSDGKTAVMATFFA